MVFIMKTEAKKLCIIWLKKQCVQNKFAKNSERNLLFFTSFGNTLFKKGIFESFRGLDGLCDS